VGNTEVKEAHRWFNPAARFSILQLSLGQLCSDFVTKKLPPPTRDWCEGRLFPPRTFVKTWRLLN
jgi:hypothetical protein